MYDTTTTTDDDDDDDDDYDDDDDDDNGTLFDCEERNRVRVCYVWCKSTVVPSNRYLMQIYSSS